MSESGIRVGSFSGAMVEAARQLAAAPETASVSPIPEFDPGSPVFRQLDPTKIPKEIWNAASKAHPVNDSMTLDEQRAAAQLILSEVMEGKFDHAYAPADVAELQDSSPVAAAATAPAAPAKPIIASPAVGTAIPAISNGTQKSMFNQTADLPQAQASAAPVGPPTLAIRYEFQGMPVQHEAFYHQIVVTPDMLVLITDRRATGYSRTMFKPCNVDVMVQIAGRDVFYLAAVTRSEFPLDNYLINILDIKNQYPLATPEE